jgi:hypothetical protein
MMMASEPAVRRNRREAEQAAAGRHPLASPAQDEWAFLRMLWAGLTNEQLSRLADLRARIRRGAYADDGETWPAGTLSPRRQEFARWLAQAGRLRES